MEKYVVMLGIAVLLIVLGVLNMKGNVSSLHSYHRRRVSEEDRLPFGKKGRAWYRHLRWRYGGVCRVRSCIRKIKRRSSFDARSSAFGHRTCNRTGAQHLCYDQVQQGDILNLHISRNTGIKFSYSTRVSSLGSPVIGSNKSLYEKSATP